MLIVLIIFAQALCVFRVATREIPSPTNNVDAVVMLESPQEAIDSLLFCPDISAGLIETCHAKEWSCYRRCGTTQTQDLRSPPRCSCDDLCKVYGDCCWNYDLHCGRPSPWEPLFFAKTICRKGIAFIWHCSNHSQSESTLELTPDDREPVVSEDGVDLHFLNRHAYDSCNKTNLLRNMNVWTKSFKEENIEHLIPDLQDFLQNGKASDALIPHLYEEPPKNVKPRSCFEYGTYSCPMESHSGCPLFRNMRVASLTLLCRPLLAHNMYSTISVTHLTSSTTQIATTLSEARTKRTSTEWTNSNSIQTVGGCSMNWINTEVRESMYSFSLLVDFTDKTDVPRITFNGLYSWNDLYCPEALWKKTDVDCQLGRKCEKGLISFNPYCDHPGELTVFSESENKTQTVELGQKIVRELYNNSKVIKIKLISKMIHLAEGGSYRFNQTFRVLQYSLEHSGEPGLDIVKILIEAFRRDKDIVLGKSLRNDSSDDESSVTPHSNNNATLCLAADFVPVVKCEDLFRDGMLGSDGDREVTVQIQKEDQDRMDATNTSSGHENQLLTLTGLVVFPFYIVFR